MSNKHVVALNQEEQSPKVKKRKASPRKQRNQLIPKKTSRIRKPTEMSLEKWQIALRKQFAVQQKFRIKNLGQEPVFSEFHVFNPDTKGLYRVAIRGEHLGDNYCSCLDFATNTLGTCKHVEWTLQKLLKKRGGKKILSEGFHPSYSEIYLRYGAKREVVFRPGKGCSEGLKKLTFCYFDARGILKREGFDHFDIFLKSFCEGGHELRCYDDAINFVAQVRDSVRLKHRVDKMFSKKGVENLLKVPLYSYQQEGALFAASAGRALIADDMGLGKTIQAIAAVEILAKTMGVERVLIISPTSLKYQWKEEIEKFADRSVGVIEGLLAKRMEGYCNDSFYKITNYDVIHRDFDLIAKWEPEVIILDEAQRIKNWKTRTARSVKQLFSEYAFVLTGTPLENRLEELHSIVEFVDRFRLGPTFRFLSEHQHVNEHGRVIGYRNLSKVAKTLEPILIRRTKDKVLKELPERLDKNFFVPMTEEQWRHHEENAEIVKRIAARWAKCSFLSDKDRQRLMIALQNMRMSCNSTYLLDEKTNFGLKTQELMSFLKDVFEKEKAKVVIFSQWKKTHALIIDHLKREGWEHVYFHGGVESQKRRELVSKFKTTDQCRLFLSTDAGGTGLNLQNAEVVINMDQPWNPAVLEQRIGRIHRLGQHRPVRVVNFIALGTIEHSMLDVLKFKKSLFIGVLDGGKDEVFLGKTRLKQFMETVEKVTENISSSGSADMCLSGGGEEDITSEHTGRQEDSQAKVGSPEKQVWKDLVSSAMSFLEKLGDSLSSEKKGASSPLSRIIDYDQTTGQPYVKLPLPSEETLQKARELVTKFTQRL